MAKEKKETYTDEQKAAILARVPEVGVRKAAEEAGIPWQTVSSWNRATSSADSADKKEKTVPAKASAKTTRKTTRKAKVNEVAAKKLDTKPVKASTKSTKPVKATTEKVSTAKAKPSPLEVENAVLKSENIALKAQVNKWKKAVQDLM